MRSRPHRHLCGAGIRLAPPHTLCLALGQALSLAPALSRAAGLVLYRKRRCFAELRPWHILCCKWSHKLHSVSTGNFRRKPWSDFPRLLGNHLPRILFQRGVHRTHHLPCGIIVRGSEPAACGCVKSPLFHAPYLPLFHPAQLPGLWRSRPHALPAGRLWQRDRSLYRRLQRPLRRARWIILPRWLH